MKYFLVLIVLLLIIGACASAKKKAKLTATSSVKEQIRFGKGGGFTGRVTEYCVIDNGDLFKRANLITERMKADKQSITACFDKCQAVGFREMTLNQPGNIYTFIEHRIGDDVHRITWNPYQPNLSKDLVSFHNMLLELVGEEPMVVEPSNSEPPVEGDKLAKKKVIQKLKPIKKKNTTSPKKQINKLKKSSTQKKQNK